jgi:hypothetical protein
LDAVSDAVAAAKAALANSPNAKTKTDLIALESKLKKLLWGFI